MDEQEYILKSHVLRVMIRAERFAAHYHAAKEHVVTGELTFAQLKQVINANRRG